ncbi:MAG TPA: hypothetical protein VEX15_14995 [Nocardioidaceae bacterium]|nr:hypothetical protein [Nocardioidaceae bacterium]
MSTQKTATALPVATTAELWPVTVIGMGESPKEREKASPDGEVTYASGCILRVQRKDGSLRADKSASVHVTKPAGLYELGVIYKATGRVFVQPYESNGRMALSITVEQLVPADADTGSAPRVASTSKEKAA